MAEENENLECPFCGFVWTPRVIDPRACPKCKRYFDKVSPIRTSKSVTGRRRKKPKKVDALSQQDKSTILCEKCVKKNPLDARYAKVKYNDQNLCKECFLEEVE